MLQVSLVRLNYVHDVQDEHFHDSLFRFISILISTDCDSSIIPVHRKDELEKEAKVKIVEAGVTDVRFFPLFYFIIIFL